MGAKKWETCLAWVRCLQRNKSPVDALYRRGINEVIVYGIVDLGETFVSEAINRGYSIKAITDAKVKKGNYTYREIPVITREMLSLPQYKETYVVITVINCFDEIKAYLEGNQITNIVSLYELMEC